MSDFPDTIEEAYRRDINEHLFLIGRIRTIATRYTESAESRVDKILESLDEYDEVRES